MKDVFMHIDGKWQCDFEALANKTNKMFALLEVERIFNNHNGHIKLVDVIEGETYINILILTNWICYELGFDKTKKECIVSSISASAVNRISQALTQQSDQIK